MYANARSRKSSSKKSRSGSAKVHKGWMKVKGQWVKVGSGQKPAKYIKRTTKTRATKTRSGKRATAYGGLTKRGTADILRADKELKHAATIIRSAKSKLTGTPRSALQAILQLLKTALDT